MPHTHPVTCLNFYGTGSASSVADFGAPLDDLPLSWCALMDETDRLTAPTNRVQFNPSKLPSWRWEALRTTFWLPRPFSSWWPPGCSP